MPTGNLIASIANIFAAPWAGNSSVAGGLERINDRWVIVGYASDANGTDFYLDGVLSARSAFVAPIPSNTMLTLMAYNGGPYPFTGDMSGIALWNSKLSQSQMKNAANILRARLLVKGYQPQSINTVYLVEGDSNSFGQQTGRYCWTHQIASLFPLSVQGSMFARSGDTLAHLESRQATVASVIQEHVTAGRRVVVSVLIGHNDTITNADQATSYYNRLAAYYGVLMAAGAKVVSCSLLPTQNENFAFKAQVNAALLADPSKYTAYCNFAANSNLGVWNSSYWADFKHPNQDGFNLMAQIAHPIISGLY
jgi:hypothetical protein